MTDLAQKEDGIPAEDKPIDTETAREEPKPRRSTANRMSIQSVTDALKKTLGNMAAAANLLNVSRGSIYHFVKTHPSLKQVVIDTRETFVDNVESALYRNALNDNVAAQIFIMKTLGKERGYTEKTEIEHSGEVHTVVRIPAKAETAEEWAQQQKESQLEKAG